MNGNTPFADVRHYRFTRWSGATATVQAHEVQFTPGGGLAFWHGPRLVLAVKAGDWNNLTEEVDRG